MKQTLPLLLMAAALAGTMSLGIGASADPVSVAQLKFETQPKKPGTPIPTPANPTYHSGGNSTAPGGYAPAPPITYHCMPGYSKTAELRHASGSRKGGLHTLKCRSPIFECPAKSSVRTDGGSTAQGHGNKIKKVPVGAGDSNRFRIEYTCNYYWPEG